MKVRADWRNDRIQKFTADGEFLMAFGGSGRGEGEFNRPTGVAVDKDGVIYVTDYKNNRLQIFDADGNFVTTLAGEATLSSRLYGLVATSPMSSMRRLSKGAARVAML